MPIRSIKKAMASCTEELEQAVSLSDVALLKQVLSRGADVNVSLESGISLLGKAIRVGNEEIIQILINAKDYLPLESTNADTQTHLSLEPFDWDCLKNNHEEFRYSGNMSDTAERPRCTGLQLFQSLRRYAIHRIGCDVNLPDYCERTPIYYAVESGNISIIQKLLEAGSKVNVSDGRNVTPLHLAVSAGYENVCRILLNAGSRVNGRTSESKSSPLHMACSRGFLSIVKLLCCHGANVNSLDASEQTPLMVAVSRSHMQVVEFLCSQGARINIEEVHGYTSLSMAVWNLDVELTETLLKSGAKIYAHHHLLHFVIRKKSLPLCQLLIHYGALINGYDETGSSPVCLAIKQRDFEIFQFLLHCGCSLNSVSSPSLETAVHVIVSDFVSHLEMERFSIYLELLIRFGVDLNEPSITVGDTPLHRSIVLLKFSFFEELIRQGCNPNLGHVFSCNIDNLTLLMHKREMRYIKLLIYSGFHLQQFSLDNIPHFDDPCWQTVISFLNDRKKNPMALSKICRIAVRKSMGFGIFKVNSLNLPQFLKHFLVFKDSEFSRCSVLHN